MTQAARLCRVHGFLWGCWATAGLTWARCAWRDWHDPAQDRAVILQVGGICGTLLAVTGLLLWAAA